VHVTGYIPNVGVVVTVAGRCCTGDAELLWSSDLGRLWGPEEVQHQDALSRPGGGQGDKEGRPGWSRIQRAPRLAWNKILYTLESNDFSNCMPRLYSSLPRLQPWAGNCTACSPEFKNSAFMPDNGLVWKRLTSSASSPASISCTPFTRHVCGEALQCHGFHCMYPEGLSVDHKHCQLGWSEFWLTHNISRFVISIRGVSNWCWNSNR